MVKPQPYQESRDREKQKLRKKLSDAAQELENNGEAKVAGAVRQFIAEEIAPPDAIGLEKALSISGHHQCAYWLREGRIMLDEEAAIKVLAGTP
jgi:hypothetical protein